MRREDLIENVEYGRMSRDEAEAEAARLGLAPLVTAPDPNAFDPMIRKLCYNDVVLLCRKPDCVVATEPD